MKDHPVVFFEIGGPNPDETRDFFTKLFGWEIAPVDPGVINTNGPIGGHITGLATEWGTYVTIYIEVDDLDAYLQKAGELGGSTLVPPVQVPGRGSFAWLAPPQGNIIGIWQPEQK